MGNLPQPLINLIKQFAGLPGVGHKSAQRFAFSVLNMSDESAEQLANAIMEAKTHIHTCKKCGGYTSNAGDCDICSDIKRNSDLLCIVESPRDAFYMDDARNGFDGRFHILGGVLSPIDKIGPSDLNLGSLTKRITDDGVKEVIIATEPDVEGDATAAYIADLVRPLGVKVTRIAYGMPMGSNIEYVDSMTLSLALEGRREI